MKKLFLSTITAAAFAVGTQSYAQLITNNYAGNGNTGFGGSVGTGSLQIVNDSLGALNFTFTRGTGDLNDALVFYFDSTGGGFSTTANFNDQADLLRQAISGASGGTNLSGEANSRSIVAFNSGFNADFAIAVATNFAGLWGLANGTNNSLSFITGVGLSPVNNASAASYTWSLNVTNLGLSINSGESFKFIGTYLNGGNSFRANEAFGFAIAGANPGNGVPGSYPSTTAASEFSFTTVPEPSTYALLALSAAGLAGYAARRRARK
jgi:hypothetical protein